MDRGELEDLDRETLVVKAQAAGIRRARILTRPELIDELLRLDPTTDESQLRKSRGFFGRARDLVARVVERGLHLPDAADRIRTMALGTDAPFTVPRSEPQAMPTVTLAEIYAAQGHHARAVETVRRVLEREPEHAAARALLARLEDQGYVAPTPRLPPEPEIEPDLHAGDDEAEAAPSEDALDDAVTVALRSAELPGPNGAMRRGVRLVDLPSDSDTEEDRESRAVTLPMPRGVPEVDVHATTDVFMVVPEADAESEAASEPVGAFDAAEVVEATAEEAVDCFAIPLPRDEAGGRMYVRWNVSWSLLGGLLGARPNGRFVVRAVVVEPTWDGPRSETRDLIVDPDDGEAVLRALPDRSVVRSAVGWLDGDAFVPLAHSPELALSADSRLMMWTPEGTVPVVLEGARAASAARALDGSRRAARASG